MQKRLLFVDDEPLLREMYEIIGSLLGEDHAITTARSGKEALALLETTHFDVVVSDLAMPEMDGLEFMNRVVREYPESARIVISGFADRMKVAECLTVGHRYFSKPFQVGPFLKLLTRIVHYSYLIEDRKVRTLVCSSGALPTPSETFSRLTDAMASDYSDLDHIAKIVEQDAGLTTKLLQVVNSAQFGTGRAVTSPLDALHLLGIEVLRALIAGMQVFDFYKEKGLAPETMRRIWGHCLRTARAARTIAHLEKSSFQLSGECFLAGLFHDIGKLILFSNAPQEYKAVEELMQIEKMSRNEAEQSTFGASHAEIGAYLLVLWGLPDSVVHAVENHHKTGLIEASGFAPLVAMHAAHALLPASPEPALDMDYIASAGLAHRVDVWREVLKSEE